MKKKRERNKSYRYVAGCLVDVKNTRMRQPALTPTAPGLMASGAPAEAEALDASFGVVRGEAERTFFTLITLPPDGQFLENHSLIKTFQRQEQSRNRIRFGQINGQTKDRCCGPLRILIRNRKA